MVVGVTKVVVLYGYPFADHVRSVLVENLRTSLVGVGSVFSDRC